MERKKKNHPHQNKLQTIDYKTASNKKSKLWSSQKNASLMSCCLWIVVSEYIYNSKSQQIEYQCMQFCQFSNSLQSTFFITDFIFQIKMFLLTQFPEWLKQWVITVSRFLTSHGKLWRFQSDEMLMTDNLNVSLATDASWSAGYFEDFLFLF